jgi:electron transfer flavoprotein alpha subunit
LRIAVLVKQVPTAESFELLPNGRLRREGVELEMNAYCRRAVNQGVALARENQGRCVVLTLGPPSAEDVLREALAWGADEAVLVTDPAFAGSDTLATSRALAAALAKEGPWDLILAGRNSIDSDTGQVGPEVAELLDLPFAGGVRELLLDNGCLTMRCELDDGWRTARVSLPAVISVAERLIEPCKMPVAERAKVEADRIRVLGAAELGPGPWGSAGSPTEVGAVRVHRIARRGIRLDGSDPVQIDEAVSLLRSWGALEPEPSGPPTDGNKAESGSERVVPAARSARDGAPVVAVVAEAGRERVTRELLGEAAELAASISGRVLAAGSRLADPASLSCWGADQAIELRGVGAEEDVAGLLSGHFSTTQPWAVLVPGTLWGREVASRLAVRLDSGLTGDAIGFEIQDERLVCWKPAFGGRLVAAITASSDIQLATVRPGVIRARAPRQPSNLPVITLAGGSRRRVDIIDDQRDDDVERLLAARAVVCVGRGVLPSDYPNLDPLLHALGAELGASRKVTDNAWLPRCRQIGLTGHSVTPALYIGIGVSGKFNHMIGACGSGTIVVVNNDPEALAFDWADIGIVGDWQTTVPLLADALAPRTRQPYSTPQTR